LYELVTIETQREKRVKYQWEEKNRGERNKERGRREEQQE